MRNVWLLAHKDIREAFGRRLILLRLLIPAVVLPVVYGGLAGGMVREAAHDVARAGALMAQVPLFAAFVVLLGSLIAVVITADAIAGEKERRTVETLLATPISDQEIFIGKLLAGVIPAIIIGYGGGLIFFVSARVVGGTAPIPVAPLLAVVRIILAGVPVLAALLAGLGVVISARCGTVTTATQLSTFASMPVFALLAYLAIKVSTWSLPQLVALLVGLVVVLALLLRLGARALDREEIIARLD